MAERVLVTGASSGIGQATIRRLLDRGLEVWATARSPEDRQALDERGARPVELDLRDQTAIEDVADRLEGRGLHGLVHNAGIGVPGAVEDLDRAAWTKQFDVNVTGPAVLTGELAPLLRAAEGRIVFVSSLAALTHVPFYGAYCASKAALEAMADSLRAEMRSADVSVSLVEPGPVETGFQARSRRLLDEHVDAEASRHRRAYDRVAEALVASLPTVPVEDVAAAVEQCLTAESPPSRLPVGRMSWLGTKLLGVLPERLQDRILAAYVSPSPPTDDGEA